jgi:hypothetical protein
VHEQWENRFQFEQFWMASKASSRWHHCEIIIAHGLFLQVRRNLPLHNWHFPVRDHNKNFRNKFGDASYHTLKWNENVCFGYKFHLQTVLSVNQTAKPVTHKIWAAVVTCMHTVVRYEFVGETVLSWFKYNTIDVPTNNTRYRHNGSCGKFHLSNILKLRRDLLLWLKVDDSEARVTRLELCRTRRSLLL